MFNMLQSAGLFLALDDTSTLNFPSTSGRKYHKLVNNAVFIHKGSAYKCILIRAHVAVATQHMPSGVWNTNYEIWSKIVT